VLLHEGLGSLDLWRDLPQEIARRTGRSVLVYSRYGYGRSDSFAEPREPDYMHHEARVVLPELLARFAIPRPVLVGHSDGASIALIYASAHDVAALVVIAPHVFVEPVTVEAIAATRASYETTELRERLSRRHRDVDATFYGWNDIWLDARFRTWNIEHVLARICAPVLMIQGDADAYGTLAQLDAIRVAVSSTTTLIVPRAGHSPQRDAPEAVTDAIVAFARVAG
jgi:pimeloyl-ACP methyl ester carboxylesterase